MTTMKKNYMSPIAEVIGVDLCNMLSSSVGIFDKDTGGDDGEGGYDAEGSLSNKRRGNWGNLWDEKYLLLSRLGEASSFLVGI